MEQTVLIDGRDAVSCPWKSGQVEAEVFEDGLAVHAITVLDGGMIQPGGQEGIPGSFGDAGEEGVGQRHILELVFDIAAEVFF